MGVAVLRRQMAGVELNGVVVTYDTNRRRPKAIEPLVFNTQVIAVLGDNLENMPLMAELTAQVVDGQVIDLVDLVRTFFREEQSTSARIHHAVRSGEPIPAELIPRPFRTSLKGLDEIPGTTAVYANFPRSFQQFRVLQAEHFSRPPLYLDFRAQGSPRNPELKRVRKALRGQSGHHMIDYLDAASAFQSAVAILKEVNLLPACLSRD